MSMSGIFLVHALPADTQAGQTVAQGISLGAQNGQLSPADQEAIFQSAASTPGGNALNTKQVAINAAVAGLVGLAVGYYLSKRRR
jgi:hypothetical protein